MHVNLQPWTTFVPASQHGFHNIYALKNNILFNSESMSVNNETITVKWAQFD